jgi:hypothetical protein
MRRQSSAPPFFILGCVLYGLSQVAGAVSPTSDFERLLAPSNQPLPPPYRAFRRLEGGVANSDKHGWLEVWTEFHPDRGLRYDVVKESGSEYVRFKILRGMLITEQELLAKGRRLRASLEAKNYEFADGGMTEDGLHRVVMKPVKKSDGIVNGRLLIDPTTQLLRRIEGRLVKSPSFWLRDVDVDWNFAQVRGYLMPIEMNSTGRVRMFGRSSFKMIYEYESIDGRSIGSGVNRRH